MHGLFSKILGAPPPRIDAPPRDHYLICNTGYSAGQAALSMMKRGNPPLVVLRRTDLDIHLFTRKTTA